MENITESQKKRIEKTIQRAIEQCKMENKADGSMHSGFLGTEAEKSRQ